MSGIYIKGMEMPTSCEKCIFLDEFGRCIVLNSTRIRWAISEKQRDDDCPLIPVPEHGDLIDRDALIKDGWFSLHKEVMRMGGYAIHELPLKNPSIPVIIPADAEEKQQTNADRLRSMTNEELADWIAQILTSHTRASSNPYKDECEKACPLYKCCNNQPSDNIEEWLKSPVEEEQT